MTRKKGLGLPVAGMMVSLLVLAIASWWPTILNLPAESTAKTPSAATQNVYHLNRTSSLVRVAPRQTEWVDASHDAVQQAGVRVRVAKVAVKTVALKDTSGRRRTSERSLVIQLRISNAGADRLVEYQSWSATAGALPSLKDSLGKSYRLKDFAPDWIVVGQIRHAWLPTAKWVDDVLVFEAPPDRIDKLRLELPCAGVGLEGRFQLEIPGRWISIK